MSILQGRDHYGNVWGPLDSKAPKRSLLRVMGRTSASPMYRDTPEGTRRIGYVVSAERGSSETPLWVTLYEVTPYFFGKGD